MPVISVYKPLGDLTIPIVGIATITIPLVGLWVVSMRRDKLLREEKDRALSRKALGE